MAERTVQDFIQSDQGVDVVQGVVIRSVSEPAIQVPRPSTPASAAPPDELSPAEDDVAQHPDLNQVRSMLAEQQRREHAPTTEVAVTRDATIVIGSDVAHRPGTTRVQPGTFASGPVDLNQIREHFHATQRAMTSGKPPDPDKTVGVTQSGEIVTGEAATRGQGITRVQPGTFASMTAQERAAYEVRIAKERLPANTQALDGGWTYSFTTQYDTQFTIYTRWGGTCYESWLISPEFEGVASTHSGHLFPNGMLCLSDTPGSGQPTLEEAYSKSVIWAHGFEVVERGWDFPFSINNL